MKTALIKQPVLLPFDRKIPVEEMVIGAVYSDIPFSNIEDCWKPPIPLKLELIEGSGVYFSIPENIECNYLKDPDNGFIGFPKSFHAYAY